MDTGEHHTPPLHFNHHFGVCFHTAMSDDARHAVADLAHALGFHDEQQTTYVPYLNYIQGCWPGKRTKNEFLQLYAEVVSFFIGEASYCPF